MVGWNCSSVIYVLSVYKEKRQNVLLLHSWIFRTVHALDACKQMYIYISLFPKCTFCYDDCCLLHGETSRVQQKVAEMVYGLSGGGIFPVLTVLSGAVRTVDFGRNGSRWIALA